MKEVEGVYELEGRGRKPLFTIENDAKKVKNYIKKLNINEICIVYEKEFLGEEKKKIRISYKRARRSIFKDTKWKTYWSKLAQINSVKGFVDKGLCDL